MQLSIRTLSALAFDRGEDFDPTQPLPLGLEENLELAAYAAAVITAAGPVERRRRRDRERRRSLAAVPEWFSVQDLISNPWEPAGAHHELV